MGRGKKSYKPFKKNWKCYKLFLFFLFGYLFRTLGLLTWLPCFVGMKNALNVRDVFERGCLVQRFYELSGKGLVIYGWRCNFDGKTNDHHGNPRKRRLPSPAMSTDTHTAHSLSWVIQPNSHLKYRFQHSEKKKKSPSWEKKKFILSMSFLLAFHI